MTEPDPILPDLPKAAFRESPSRSALVVDGPDAADFLHRLSSQDVMGLDVGQLAPAAFLNPKGRLEATAEIARIAPTRFLVIVPVASRESLAALLDRYHFTEKLSIEDRAEDAVAELVGSEACVRADRAVATVVENSGLVLAASERFGVQRVLATGPAEAVAAWRASIADASQLAAPWDELLRIRAGDVRPGVDFDERTIGLEANLDDHVSTTKGCYTGQEIVARIHTYGHVNRRLVLLDVAGQGAIDTGTPLCETEDGDAVGRVTSAADVPGAERRLALGYVPNAFVEPGSDLRLGAVDGPAVRVVAFERA
jgi:folate-binding protein YgfZ